MNTLDFIHPLDFLLLPFYFILAYSITLFIRNKNLVKGKQEYKNFHYAVLLKMLGAIALTAVYNFYYAQGDTCHYFRTGKALKELLFTRPLDYLEIMFGNPRPNPYYYFYDLDMTWPSFWINDPYSFFVSKVASVVEIFSFGFFFPTAVCFSFIGFYGLWKLYIMMCDIFRDLKKELFISLFVFPSVFFWTSGVLKDTLTLMAICLYLYAFYFLMIKRKFKVWYLIQLLLAVYIHINVKPYVLYALLPGSLIWFSVSLLDKYNASFMRSLFTIVLVSIGSAVGFFLLTVLGNKLGTFSMDKVVNRTTEVRDDLKKDYYQGKSFSIGQVDNSVSGMLKVAPLAIFTGLFRPTLIDVRNFFMLLSALENTFLLYLLIKILIKYKWRHIYNSIQANSIMIFMLLFSLFFAFTVGITISNFGALVRLKTPALPFFVMSLFIIDYYCKNKLYLKKNLVVKNQNYNTEYQFA